MFIVLGCALEFKPRWCNRSLYWSVAVPMFRVLHPPPCACTSSLCLGAALTDDHSCSCSKLYNYRISGSPKHLRSSTRSKAGAPGKRAGGSRCRSFLLLQTARQAFISDIVYVLYTPVNASSCVLCKPTIRGSWETLFCSKPLDPTGSTSDRARTTCPLHSGPVRRRGRFTCRLARCCSRCTYKLWSLEPSRLPLYLLPE